MLQQKNRVPKPEDNHPAKQAIAGDLSITYFTDPLCCWSWAFEIAWQKLKKEFSNSITWRYCMVGLLPDWKTYYDAKQSISRPLQMGPLWMEVKHTTGRPVNDRIWFEDPPASSYPACLAVKSAARQSAAAEDLYLLKLREAVMAKGKNIAHTEVLIKVAEDLAKEKPGILNVEQLKKDITDCAGLEAFRKDLAEVQSMKINRFPTLLIKNSNKKGIILTGNRPFEEVQQALYNFGSRNL